MNYISTFFKSILIGAGGILPGISSGVLCVIFGIYENLLDSILNFFKDIKKNTKFLLPILSGIFVGIFLFSKLLNFLLINFPLQTKSIFIGFILGGILPLIREIDKKADFRFNYLFYTLIAFLFGIFFIFLENNIHISQFNNINFIYLLLCGFFMSIGVVIPGVSSTIILMLLGVYSTYISSISNLYFPVLLPIGIGLLFGSLFFMKLTKFLLKHFYAKTFYTIIGFTLGSIFILFPNISFDFSGFICICCIILGYIIVQYFV